MTYEGINIFVELNHVRNNDLMGFLIKNLFSVYYFMSENSLYPLQTQQTSTHTLKMYD